WWLAGPGRRGTAIRGRGGRRGRGRLSAGPPPLDQGHRARRQPRGGGAAVVVAGGEQVGGQLLLQFGGGGTLLRLHAHTGLDQRPQLLGQPVEVGPLPQQHEDRLHRVGAVEGGVPGGRVDQGGAQGEDVSRAGDR